MANMRGELPLRVEVDAGDCETHSSYSYHAGGRVLSIATVLPERGLALELISTYVGHPDTGTTATHLTLGPERHSAQMHVELHIMRLTRSRIHARARMTTPTS